MTKIGDQVWHRAELEDTSDTNRLIIRERPDGVKVQFGGSAGNSFGTRTIIYWATISRILCKILTD